MSEAGPDALYWPYYDALGRNGCLRGGLKLAGVVFLVTVIAFPGAILCFWLVWYSDRYNIGVLERRKRTFKRTGSVLMSHVEYVGGHPLVHQAQHMVIGLSASAMTMYQVNPWPKDKEQQIRPLTSIPLDRIIHSGMGRPKTAREVYDSDRSHSTVEVWETSPFLRVSFELSGDIYTMSFEQFLDDTPQEWHNQIISLSYECKTKAGSVTP